MIPSVTFLIAALILAVTPGLGIAYVVARTAAGGKAEGLASCLGISFFWAFGFSWPKRLRHRSGRRPRAPAVR